MDAPWRAATECWTTFDAAIDCPWKGRVWLNPPYGDQCEFWLRRLAEHGNGIAIIFARTETEMFRKWVWEKADAVFFFYGRLHFHYPSGERAKGNAGGPSCLVAYGEVNVMAINAALNSGSIRGKLLRFRP